MKFKEVFFGPYSTSLQVFIYAALIISLWLIEASVLLPTAKQKWKHSSNNVLFILTGLPVQLLMSIFVVIVSAWTVKNHFGLLNILPHADSIFVKFIVGFIALDFCEYLYHVIMHKVKALWKFHIVHHTDQQLDVSTTVREHPGETFVRVCFLIVWVSILGASLELLLIRQSFQTVINISSHTTFRFSQKYEKWLGLVFITPNIHQVHHHYQLPYTDCNYGDVLSIWDRLFGTFGKLDSSETIYGIDTHMDTEICGSFLNVVKIPFKHEKFHRPNNY